MFLSSRIRSPLSFFKPTTSQFFRSDLLLKTFPQRLTSNELVALRKQVNDCVLKIQNMENAHIEGEHASIQELMRKELNFTRQKAPLMKNKQELESKLENAAMDPCIVENNLKRFDSVNDMIRLMIVQSIKSGEAGKSIFVKQSIVPADEEVWLTLMPYIKALGMTCQIVYDRDVLHNIKIPTGVTLSIPYQLNKVDIAFITDNQGFQSWLQQRDQELRLYEQQAKDAILNDTKNMREVLIEPLSNVEQVNNKVMMEYEPCGAAYDRILSLAKAVNVKIEKFVSGSGKVALIATRLDPVDDNANTIKPR